MLEHKSKEEKLDNISKKINSLTKPLRILHFLQDLPETEIHIHIEAMIRVETLLKLIAKNDLSDQFKVHNEDELYERFQVDNIIDFINVFHMIQSSFVTEEDFKFLIDDAKDYCKRNNIYYAEIFLAPTRFIKNGLSFKKIINVINDELKTKNDNYNTDIKLLIDVSRNYGLENAMKNLNFVLDNRTDIIIGIGIGGAENLYGAGAKNYKEVFKKAIENDLKVVAHAGEVIGPESIWETLKELNVARIGHGISAIYDEKLMNYLKDKQIPLEICPTSNIFTQKFVKKLSEHPIREFFDRGLNVTINSDDPSIFGVELNDEYLNLYKHCNFTLKEIIQLIKNNLYATFLSKKEKDAYWKVVEKEIDKLKEKYNIEIE